MSGLWRYVDAEVWDDPWFHGLDAPYKLLFLWVITNPRILPCGIVETTPAHLVFDTGVPTFDVAVLKGKVDQVYSNGGLWLFARNFLRRQRVHTNLHNANIRAAQSLRGCPLPVRAAVLHEYPELRDLMSEPESKPLSPQQAMVGALAAIEGRETVSRGDASRLGKMAKELLEQEVEPADVFERAVRYRECKPDWELTANALVKWWTSIPSWTPPQGKVKHGLATTLLAAADEMEGAHGDGRSDKAGRAPLRGLPRE